MADYHLLWQKQFPFSGKRRDQWTHIPRLPWSGSSAEHPGPSLCLQVGLACGWVKQKLPSLSGNSGARAKTISLYLGVRCYWKDQACDKWHQCWLYPFIKVCPSTSKCSLSWPEPVPESCLNSDFYLLKTGEAGWCVLVLLSESVNRTMMTFLETSIRLSGW